LKRPKVSFPPELHNLIVLYRYQSLNLSSFWNWVVSFPVVTLYLFYLRPSTNLIICLCPSPPSLAKLLLLADCPKEPVFSVPPLVGQAFPLVSGTGGGEGTALGLVNAVPSLSESLIRHRCVLRFFSLVAPLAYREPRRFQ